MTATGSRTAAYSVTLEGLTEDELQVLRTIALMNRRIPNLVAGLGANYSNAFRKSAEGKTAQALLEALHKATDEARRG